MAFFFFPSFLSSEQLSSYSWKASLPPEVHHRLLVFGTLIEIGISYYDVYLLLENL
jgi:hypothetical protein